ncbi:hypothetical protein GN244_ATG06224 [Phytophthora infestans]|uniref:Uncharacterized protein n=1 Tax=Phytophthora infestans TaxID=4787 RepID=A0A833S686_PHYIN|nr:hypothetical protein GN244_ATG06224 [Phytophthora infestans]KAF4132965.1 hypothetical protein GN958_ATG17874 [Phytophthora infestans]
MASSKRSRTQPPDKNTNADKDDSIVAQAHAYTISSRGRALTHHERVDVLIVTANLKSGAVKLRQKELIAQKTFERCQWPFRQGIAAIINKDRRVPDCDHSSTQTAQLLKETLALFE